MGYKLVIAEKPMLARDIARAMCGRPVSESERLPISGNGFTVVACAGHLLELVDPEKVNPAWGKPWSLDVLPIEIDDGEPCGLLDGSPDVAVVPDQPHRRSGNDMHGLSPDILGGIDEIAYRLHHLRDPPLGEPALLRHVAEYRDRAPQAHDRGHHLAAHLLDEEGKRRAGEVYHSDLQFSSPK